MQFYRNDSKNIEWIDIIFICNGTRMKPVFCYPWTIPSQVVHIWMTIHIYTLHTLHYMISLFIRPIELWSRFHFAYLNDIFLIYSDIILRTIRAKSNGENETISRKMWKIRMMWCKGGGCGSEGEDWNLKCSHCMLSKWKCKSRW